MKDTTTINGKPLLDAESFQKLLAAAYVLQEHNDQQRAAGAAEANSAAAAQTHAEEAEVLDTAHLAEAATQSDYTQTLAQIVATQQQIQMSHLDLREAMDLITDRTRQITRAAGSAIGLLEKKKLAYRAASGSARVLAGTKVETDSCLPAQCLTHGESLPCADVNTDMQRNAQFCWKYGIKAFIAAPIFYEGKVVGAIELHFAAANAFQEHDLRTCQLMAGLVAEAMARAAEVEWKQALAAERATVLEALDRLKPQLQRLAHEPEPAGAESVTARWTTGAAPEPAMSPAIACTECGYPLDAAQLFCGQCGTEQPAPKKTDIQSKWASLSYLSQTQPAQGTRRSPEAAANGPMSSVPLEENWEPITTSLGAAKDSSGVLPTTAPVSDSHAGSELQTWSAKAGGQIEQAGSANPVVKSYPWTSAAKAKAWLDSQGGGHSGGAFLRLWKARRADIYLAIAAILIIVAIRWVIWSDQTTTALGSSKPAAASSGNPATTASTRRKQAPPQPKLSLMEQLLVSLGLAEAPPAPAYTGNPGTQVWVDLHTALYYCPGADLYGKTPKGKFTSQRDAQMDQFEPASRRACD